MELGSFEGEETIISTVAEVAIAFVNLIDRLGTNEGGRSAFYCLEEKHGGDERRLQRALGKSDLVKVVVKLVVAL